MIEYLRGKLVAVSPGRAVLEIGSAGVTLEIPEETGGLERLIGTEVLFYTRPIFREDDLRLIGFQAAEERDLFNLVTGVSGFGPRLGLALLGSLSVTQICAAILREDIPTLCHAPGVGKKMAQRLIFELKEKVSHLHIAEVTAPTEVDSCYLEAVEALQGLGYSAAEASAAVNKALDGAEGVPSSKELLKNALNLLAGRRPPGR